MLKEGSQPKAQTHRKKEVWYSTGPTTHLYPRAGWTESQHCGEKKMLEPKSKGKRWIRRHVWREVWNIIASKVSSTTAIMLIKSLKICWIFFLIPVQNLKIQIYKHKAWSIYTRINMSIKESQILCNVALFKRVYGGPLRTKVCTWVEC